MQLVLDGPVPLDPRGGLLRGCLRGGHRGDDVDDLDALLAREGAGASDLGDLDRTGEVQQCGCGGDLDRAPDPAPVPAVQDRGGADLGSGQCFAPSAQARLVAFHGEHVVPAAAGDVGGGGGLGVHRIGGCLLYTSPSPRD